jgi:hypothetical protein
MIVYSKKPVPEIKPTDGESEANRFDTIRKTAVDQHKKSDTDGTRRRERQTAEDNRIV